MSPRACEGILKRAEKKGKQLPEPLKNALIQQITQSKLGGGIEIDSKGHQAGKGALIQKELSGCLGTVQDQTLFQDVPTVYGISPFESNFMNSSNPDSGIYEAETSRTLDLNGGSPNCHQGGMVVLEPTKGFAQDAYDKYTETEQSPTLRALGGVYGGAASAW